MAGHRTICVQECHRSTVKDVDFVMIIDSIRVFFLLLFFLYRFVLDTENISFRHIVCRLIQLLKYRNLSLSFDSNRDLNFFEILKRDIFIFIYRERFDSGNITAVTDSVDMFRMFLRCLCV